jgi:CubicO group peptidase (beta-lactamase class C family)
MPRSSLFVAMTTLVAGCTPTLAGAPAPAVRNPTAGWLQYRSPEAAGFSSAKLARAQSYADSVKSGAVMVVYRGAVVVAWGDVSRKLELHSVRKSMVSALFGIAADRHQVSLDATLGELRITDRGALTAVEQGARVRDLLAARSGVFLPAAYADISQDNERPPRGSHAPNTFWFYNNWDFNTLGTIYEQTVEPALYESLAARLARPIGMEDFTPDDGFLVYEPSSSVHPAHTMRMSTRDLARFGQLYLQGGQWNGRQVVPRAWVAESTSPKSNVGQTQRGYGYLWWTQAAGPVGSYPEVDRRNLFYGSGTGGQLVAVIPSDELVIVHRGDTDHGRNVSGRDAWRIVDLILAARTGEVASTTDRVALSTVPFMSQLPAVQSPTFAALDAAAITDLAGDYEIAPNMVVRVFEFRGKLFGNFPGQGEAELFSLTRDEFTIRVQAGVHLTFERDATGRAIAFSAQIGPRRFRGTRRAVRPDGGVVPSIW